MAKATQEQTAYKMALITQLLTERFILRVKAEKSAVDRPWNLKYLGYSMTNERKPRLKPAEKPVERLKTKLRAACGIGRGRLISRTIAIISPILRGWCQYFKLTRVKQIFELLDGWIRRKLRCLLWIHWKRPKRRYLNLVKWGLDDETAKRSTGNGHGSWWNAGASHMNKAFPKKILRFLWACFFDGHGTFVLMKLTNRRIRNCRYGGVRGRGMSPLLLDTIVLR
jgi:RNA-directed DNA polymerase